MAGTYITKENETWDMAAKSALGSELLADRLMDANRKLIGVYAFAQGTVLAVPDFEGDEADGLPPWRD